MIEDSVCLYVWTHETFDIYNSCKLYLHCGLLCSQAGSSGLRQLEKEVSIFKKVDHRNIIKLKEVIESSKVSPLHIAECVTIFWSIHCQHPLYSQCIKDVDCCLLLCNALLIFSTNIQHLLNPFLLHTLFFAYFWLY